MADITEIKDIDLLEKLIKKFIDDQYIAASGSFLSNVVNITIDTADTIKYEKGKPLYR